MKSLREYVFNNEFESYLIDDLILSIECRKAFDAIALGMPTSFTIPLLFETLGEFLNCGNVVHEIWKKIDEELDEENISSFEDEPKKLDIDVEKCESYCKTVHLTISYTDDNFSGGTYKSTIDGDVYMTLKLNRYFKIEMAEVQGIILHELLHGYEEHNRQKRGKISLFDELSDRYKNARDKLSINNNLTRMIAQLEYQMHKSERNANFGKLKTDIENIINKLNPTSSGKIPTDKIKDELNKLNVWKNYVEFGKFVLEIDDIPDKTLENEYYFVVTDKAKKKEDLDNDIAQRRQGLKPKNYKRIKTAAKIRSDAKNKWFEFIKKFNQLFTKIYCEYVLDNLKNVKETYESPLLYCGTIIKQLNTIKTKH